MPSPNLNSAVRESAPYGHACAGCSKAKCRCIGRGPGNSCERCHRLSKECQSSGIVRKRLARRPANKTTRLEEKLDDLVTLLKTQATASTSESGAGLDGPQFEQEIIGPEDSRPGVVTWEHSLPIQSNESVPPLQTTAESGTLSTNSSLFTTPYSISPLNSLGLPTSQAEEYLRVFRCYHLQSFPFVHLPPEVTAAQLQSERPFLWLNIQAICSKVTVERNKLNKKIREILAQSIVVDSERSLDLLLGLLAFLAWTIDHGSGKKTLCTFSSLATSLVFDLRLDRYGQENPCKEIEPYKAFGYPIRQYLPAPERTNEERRATLACFATCSTISSFLSSPTMRWTPHMEDCLQYLAAEPEIPGDEVLVAIVKFSKIMDDVSAAASWRLFDPVTSGTPKVPPVLHVKALQANLEATVGQLGPDIAQNKVVRSYMYDTCMLVNNLPLNSVKYPTKIPGLLDFGRTECFYACIDAIQKGIDNWFSSTIEELFGKSMPLLLHFGRYTHILYRLSMTEDPAWDRAAVRKAVDLIQVLERSVGLVSSVPQSVGLETDGSDFWTKSAATLRNAITIWKRAFAESDAAGNASTAIQNDPEPGAVDFVASDFVPMDFSDDFWLSDIFTTWENY